MWRLFFSVWLSYHVVIVLQRFHFEMLSMNICFWHLPSTQFQVVEFLFAMRSVFAWHPFWTRDSHCFSEQRQHLRGSFVWTCFGCLLPRNATKSTCQPAPVSWRRKQLPICRVAAYQHWSCVWPKPPHLNRGNSANVDFRSLVWSSSSVNADRSLQTHSWPLEVFSIVQHGHVWDLPRRWQRHPMKSHQVTGRWLIKSSLPKVLGRLVCSTCFVEAVFRTCRFVEYLFHPMKG